MALPLIASLALGSGGASGGILSTLGGGGILGTASNLVGNVPIVGSLLSSITSNPLGTISTVGNTIGSIFSSNAGAVQLADKRTGYQYMQGVMLFLHDINQQKGGVWLAGEDCSYVGDDWNDNVTGVLVAPGFEFTFYEGLNYSGKSFTLSANDPVRKPNEAYYLNAANQWWNDKLSSFQIRKVDKNAISFAEAESLQLKQSNVSKTPVLSDPPLRPIDTPLPSGGNWNGYVGDNNFNQTTDKTDTTKTEPEKKGSMMWLIFLAIGLFLGKDKIAKLIK